MSLKPFLRLFAIVFFTHHSLCVNTYAQEADADYLHTGLPVCRVDYDSTLTLTKENIKAHFTLTDGNDTLSCDTKFSGRGNYTWLLPKKSYNIKLADNSQPLGMPRGKKFALLACHSDPSLCRTAIGFEAGRWVGFDHPLEGRYVELLLNGKHQGTYYLTERVNRNTVGVDKENGYIVEFKSDSQLDTANTYFCTSLNNWYMEFKDPDNLSTDGEMYADAVTRINAFEQAIFASDALTARKWERMVDMDNFVRWFYWKQLMQMDECDRYYVVEDYTKDTPIRMGPLWDYDWCIGLTTTVRHYDEQYWRFKLYFIPLYDDTKFHELLANFHFSHRKAIEEKVKAVYDSLTTLLRPSVELNQRIWGLAYNVDPETTWDKELATDRSFMLATLKFLDEELSPYYKGDDLAVRTPTTTTSVPATQKIYRNGMLYIRRGTELYDCWGRRVSGK